MRNALKPSLTALTLALLLISACTSTSEEEGESRNTTASDKQSQAGAELKAEAEGTLPKRRNVILMISDGIGFNGWLASDYYQHGAAGQHSYQRDLPSGTPSHVYGMSHWSLTFVDAEGKPVSHDGTLMPEGAVGAIPQLYDPATRWGELEGAFRWDFDPVGKSYTSYTDSAASITAIISGRKTTNGRLNMSWNGQERYTTLAESADLAGLATGAVSSVQASHATPAGVWSHSITRHAYNEIFDEMTASGLDVIMGAGHPWSDEKGKRVQEPNWKYISEESWTTATSKEGLNGFAFVEKRGDFERIAKGEGELPAKLLGIPHVHSTLQAARSTSENKSAATPSGDPFNEAAPSLASMSLAALNVLNQDEDGFFVMIEGGAVDWMNHANHLPRMIEEQMDFDASVEAVIKWVETNSSWDETLLIVTSDHDCGSIWGAGTYETSGEDGRFNPDRGDALIEYRAVENAGRGVIPSHQYASGYHTNDLVPLWVIGVESDSLTPWEKYDRHAAALWGEPYGWNGRYIDSTELYLLMRRALLLNGKR